MAHPMAPLGQMPKTVGGSAQPVSTAARALKDGEVPSRSMLSLRFRYRAPSAAELSEIDSGGADIVF